MATINPSNQTITQYNLQTGDANNLLNNVAPSATSGVPVISQGAASQPVFGTAEVVGGGTGRTSLTNHGVLVGAATSAITQLAAGSAGQVLQSGGASADPAYSTATYPATTTANQLLYSSATNTVSGLTGGNSLVAATNSSGTLAMRSFSINIQTFTSSGTYTPTAGMLYCIIEAVGGGGGGGGAAATGANNAVGGGGGAGGYARLKASAATIGASQTVTINTGGAGGTAGANNGSNGGSVTFGALITCNGGTGGTGGAAGNPSYVAGGAGGTATGGDVNIAGGRGSYGFGVGTSNVNSLGGLGGNSMLGFASTAGGSATSGTGVSAGNYGAGGSGGYSSVSSAAAAGGNGSNGIVIVTEYIIA